MCCYMSKVQLTYACIHKYKMYLSFELAWQPHLHLQEWCALKIRFDTLISDTFCLQEHFISLLHALETPEVNNSQWDLQS